ncbi:hypothetical protein OS493_006546 [Desmophyllum pertusum]|uniref:EGF-like domain-containing protein n=1 Tax=Desmophyllum pertusum TaxID=174260 RepID=A0A9X0A510_9CNID|nr:hypothetical protein OS493_006546 [Desmophyllum pertusum]
MGPIAKHILAWVVIAFFIGGLHALDYPAPAKCESDRDCLKGKAKCIRRECHCTSATAYGDGKTKCEQWKRCPKLLGRDSCTYVGIKGFVNTHCIMKPGSRDKTCKCDNGYFGSPKHPQCMSGADKNGRYPCLTDKNCPLYSECVNNRCSCRHELTGNGETCKPPPMKSCSSNADCHTKNGKCYDGKCRCVGLFVGDGVQCNRKGKSCPRNKKCDIHASCFVDPLYPRKPICRCDEGFTRSKDGKRCIECLSDKDCKQTYSTCYKGICKCKDELIRDEKTCKPAPSHECKEDKDCDARAKCEEGKCVCQGNATGNGKYCRDSLPCSPDYQCGSGGKCLVDPFFPNKPKCRCDKGYSYTKDNKCVECVSNMDCNANYSTCDKGICKCKDELIKMARHANMVRKILNGGQLRKGFTVLMSAKENLICGS